MVTTYEHGKLAWIDMASPTQDEIRDIVERYGINLRIAEEIASPTPKPAVLCSEGIVFLILHFPAFKHTHKNQKNQEVDFIITEKALITIRYDTIDPLHKFAKQFEVNSILERDEEPAHAFIIAAALIRKLYRAVQHEIDYLHDAMHEIERQIFSGKEKEMVYELSQINRELLNFKQTLIPHKEVLAAFERFGREIYPKRFIPYLERLSRERELITESVENSAAFHRALRETNDSMLYTKQNEIMKTLTIMAFVTFPLTLITGIFGMNTNVLPVVGREHDFWLITGFMAVITVFFFIFFKYKRWL